MLRFDESENVLTSDAELLVNTVNTVGVMGAGVAKAIKTRYPEIMEPYTEACRTRRLYPGGVQLLRMRDGRHVVNLASKKHFKDPSKIEWVGFGLLNLRRVLSMDTMRDVRTVCLPPPGAGLGGLSPEKVQRMMRTYMHGLSQEIIASTRELPIVPRRVIYTGVGSRETPREVLGQMTEVAGELAGLDWTLRSGNAVGADMAFERGAPVELTESYLPWPKDEVPHGIVAITPEHTRLMRSVYRSPRGEPWNSQMGRSATLLMTRNGNQVFGPDFSEPSDVLVCWTPGGRPQGGTRQAIALAEIAGIPVINLGSPEWVGRSVRDIVDTAVETVVRRRQALGIPLETSAPNAPAP